METVRIGCVQYLNTLPLIEGLRAWRDAEIVTAVPSRLIGMLMEGEVDLALASVVDAAQGVDGRAAGAAGAVVLPVGMIGCDGPTLTVRVFSERPVESLERIYADTDSHTSVALLRVLFARKFGRVIEVVDFDARERIAVGPGARSGVGAERDPPPGPLPLGGGGDGWPDAVLLIGDKVVTDAPPAERYPYQMDLGQAWKELTGLPFVYAVWMCRAGEEGSVTVRMAAEALDRQRRHNATRLDWVVASRAGERGWPRGTAGEYVGSYLKYSVGEAEREAVGKFLGWAAELGVVGGGGVRWVGEEGSKAAKQQSSK